MPHIIGDMDQCLDQMRGNASTGRLVDLKTAYHALNDHLPTLPPPKALEAHQLLEDIQSWLCDGGTYSQGAADQAATFTGNCNNYL